MADASPRLYVGNLPYVAQKADVEELFAKNGVLIKNVDISIDSFTGRNPSYCFVDFHDEETARLAMSTMQGRMVRGRPVKINLKTARKPAGQRPQITTFDRGWRAKEIPSQDVDNEHAYAFDRWTRDDAPSRWTAPTEEKRRLWVGGLPRISGQGAVNMKMRDLFGDYEVEAVSKIISPDAIKQHIPGSHYSCYVDLATNEEARHAIRTLNGKRTPYGGNYKIDFAVSKRPITKVEREQLGVKSRIFVGGLPDLNSQEDVDTRVREIFEGWKVAKIGALIKPFSANFIDAARNNYCFVDLANAAAAQQAVDEVSKRTDKHGRSYRVKIADHASTERRLRSEADFRQQAALPAPPRDFGGNWRHRG